jgi:hypothetical protein
VSSCVCFEKELNRNNHALCTAPPRAPTLRCTTVSADLGAGWTLGAGHQKHEAGEAGAVVVEEVGP